MIARAEGGLGLASSDVPRRSPTQLLRDYPDDAVAPQRVTSASFTVEPGAATVVGATSADGPQEGTGLWATVEEWTGAWSGLVARQQLSVGVVALGAVLALVLGAGHALAPGHGKTVMAAYLVGERGTTRQALGLGLTVATTHTLGVVVLGVVLSVTQTLTPDRLYPVLGAISGGLFAAVGVGLLVRTLRRRGHRHAADDHHHHPHGLTWRGLVLPGLAGGMVPSPSALVVLLGGAALGRAWLGVGLVLLYGMGMAATLVGVGWGAARMRDGLRTRITGGSPRWEAIARAIPIAMSVVMILGGLALGLRSLIVA